MARLECLGAKHGDCMVLHHGTTKILFDGGPSGIYSNFLKPWIKAHKPDDGPVVFDLGMVTHIDDDHINGLLALTNDMVSALDDSEAQSVRFGQFWFNSFSGLTGQDFHSASVASVVAAASDPAFDPRDERFSDARTGEIIASIGQGHELSNNLGKLGLPGNGVFNGLVLGRRKVKIADGLEFDVVGPGEVRLKKLRAALDLSPADHISLPFAFSGSLCGIPQDERNQNNTPAVLGPCAPFDDRQPSPCTDPAWQIR